MTPVRCIDSAWQTSEQTREQTTSSTTFTDVPGFADQPSSPEGGGPDSFSFQWIEKNQSAAEHVNGLQLQWRSTNGSDVRLLRGDMAVSYDTEPGGCVGSS